MSQAPDRDTAELTPAVLSPPPTFSFCFGDHARQFTYQQAFAFGHALLRANKLDSATAVFAKLTTVKDHGPRAHIMLALCKASQASFKEARAVLDGVFPDKQATLAEAIHQVLVESRIGFKDNALRELVALVNGHAELPTLCLWLGDLLDANNQVAKAVQCWKLAIKRDRRGGAVALAANQQLKRIETKRRPATDAT